MAGTENNDDLNLSRQVKTEKPAVRRLFLLSGRFAGALQIAVCLVEGGVCRST